MRVPQTINQTVQVVKRSQRITIYPYLVTQKQFWLQLYNIEKCVFTVHLYTLTGKQVYKMFIYHSDFFSSHVIRLPHHIERGIYKVAVRYGENHFLQPIVVG